MCHPRTMCSLTGSGQRRRRRITGIIIKAVRRAALAHDALGRGGEGDGALLDQLLHRVVRVEDVLLDKLERAGSVGELIGQAVRQLGALQLALFGAE